MIRYGLLVNENNENIGDDIQSYAESRFLPRVDILCNREKLDEFVYGDGSEPVGLIMGAWFMWHKYNWPPARQIIPLVVGYHHFNRQADLSKSSSYALPITDEHYEGIGGQWFKDYGKVGCRDLFTLGVFEKKGIPAYFSGCVTLTLPKQKETKDKGKYIVLCDLNEDVEKKVIELAQGKFEIKKVTHQTLNIEGESWEKRQKRVIEFLTLYQNAAYVVTRRLHVALPCLAMEVPVMVIQSYKMNDPNRFDPYRDWLHYARNDKFLKEGYDGFDFTKGTPNKKDYLKYRKELIKTIENYVKYLEDNKDKPLEFFDKRSFSDLELYKWKSEFMKLALQKAHFESKALFNTYIKPRTVESNSFKIVRSIYRGTIKKTKLKDTQVVKKIRRRLNKKFVKK